MSEGKPKRNALAIAIGIIVIVIVVGVAGYFLYNAFGIGKPSDVLVSGTVTTTGTYPQKITFTSESTGNPYVANVNAGTYSITLPNHDTYNATITYGRTISSAGVIAATANVGTLNLDTTQSSITENWVG